MIPILRDELFNDAEGCDDSFQMARSSILSPEEALACEEAFHISRIFWPHFLQSCCDGW